MFVKIQIAQSNQDFAAVESLIRQYVGSLEFDLSFQDYQNEINDLEGKYRPPASAMFIAKLEDNREVGCCGFSPLNLRYACEIKRLFVLPEARGHKIAQALMSTIILAAKDAGYEKMYLDTLPTMRAAINLYKAFGFEQVPPYYNNPIDAAVFYCKSL